MMLRQGARAYLMRSEQTPWPPKTWSMICSPFTSTSFTFLNHLILIINRVLNMLEISIDWWQVTTKETRNLALKIPALDCVLSTQSLNICQFSAPSKRHVPQTRLDGNRLTGTDSRQWCGGVKISSSSRWDNHDHHWTMWELVNEHHQWIKISLSPWSTCN